MEYYQESALGHTGERLGNKVEHYHESPSRNKEKGRVAKWDIIMSIHLDIKEKERVTMRSVITSLHLEI